MTGRRRRTCRRKIAGGHAVRGRSSRRPGPAWRHGRLPTLARLTWAGDLPVDGIVRRTGMGTGSLARVVAGGTDRASRAPAPARGGRTRIAWLISSVHLHDCSLSGAGLPTLGRLWRAAMRHTGGRERGYRADRRSD
jgi:hypothetical protein